MPSTEVVGLHSIGPPRCWRAWYTQRQQYSSVQTIVWRDSHYIDIMRSSVNHCIIGAIPKLFLLFKPPLVAPMASGSCKAPAKKVPTKKAPSKNIGVKSSKKNSGQPTHSKYSFTRYRALNTGETPVNKRKRAPTVLVHDSNQDVPLSPLSFQSCILCKIGRTNSGPTKNISIPSVPLTRAMFNRAKKVVAGHDIFMDVDSLTAITKGKGKDKDLMAAFIDDEADKGENGSSDEVDHEEYEEQDEE
ncbi:hypothetical protein K439DRAFT_1624772 [Ramaria rubella]|nr:hypothetical protein K439DRAFT_1624772 [Ramaria rubella]